MRFDSVTSKLETFAHSSRIPLEEALCLMYMVGQDVLKDGQVPIDNLEVENWERLRRYLLSITNTVNRLYKKHRDSLTSHTVLRHNDQLWGNIENASAELSEIEKESSRLENEKSELESLLKKLKTKEALITDLQKQISSLTMRCNTIRAADVDKLEKQRDSLEAEYEKAQNDLNALKQHILTLNGQIKEATQTGEQEQKKISKLNLDLNNQKKLNITTTKNCTDLQKKLDIVVDENNQLADRYQQLQDAIRTAQNKADEARHEVKKLEDTSREKQGFLDHLKNKKTELRSDVDRIQTQIDDATAACDLLDSQFIELRKELDDRNTAYDDRRTEIKDMEALIDAARQKITDLEKDETTVRETLRTAADERDAAQSRYDECYGQLQTVLQKKRDYDRQISDTEAENQNLSKELEKLRATRDAKATVKNGYEQELKNLNGELDRLAVDCKDLDEQIRTAKQNKTARESESSQLSTDLKDVNTLLSQAENRKKQLEQDLKTAKDQKQKLDTAIKSLEDQLALLANVEQQREEAAGKLAETHQSLAEATKKRDDLNTAIDQCNASIETIGSEIVTLTANQTDADALLARRQAERDKLDEKVRAAEELLNKLLDDVADLQKRLDAANKTHAEKKKESEQLATDLATAETDNRKMLEDVVSLNISLEDQLKDNESYRTNYLIPAQTKLNEAKTVLEQMKATVTSLDEESRNIDEERRQVGDQISTAKTTNAVKRQKVNERIKELEDEQKRFDDMTQEENRLNTQLKELTQDKIQPLLDAIERAKRMLRDLNPEVTLKEYQQQKEDLELEYQQQKKALDDEAAAIDAKKVEIETLNTQCNQLIFENEQIQAELAEARQNHQAKADSQQQLYTEHDGYKQKLAMLDSDENKQAVEACRNRLDTMMKIRQNLSEISARMDTGLDYTDALDNGISLACDILAKLQDNISSYAQIWEENIDQ